jgi:hypothetical protein
MKYLCTLDIANGVKAWELVDADNEDMAEARARELCIDLADSYGFEQNLDFFGDYDTLGREWDDDEEEYQDTGFLEYYVEPYDEEEHSGYIY